MVIFILKLAAAAFLVSLNVFSFLLIRFQKTDREKKILMGIAEGDKPQNIDLKEKPGKPEDADKEQAETALKDLDSKPEKEQPAEIRDTSWEMPKDSDKKKEEKEKLLEKFSKKPVSDFKIIMCALLGGALGIYISLFVHRYRLRDIMMMVLIPTILVINVYIYYQLFTVWILVPGRLAGAFLNP